MSAARHLRAVPDIAAPVIPLPRPGVDRTPLAERVLGLAADGRVTRTQGPAGPVIRVSGRPAARHITDQLQQLTEAGLVAWITYRGPSDGAVAVATPAGRALLQQWPPQPGGAA